jgi:chromosome segregation ATPase
MQMKTIAMMAAVGCAATLLTGCGVKQEVHDAKITELNTAWAEIESLKGKNADIESLNEAEKAKQRTLRIELDDAEERIATSQTKQNELADELTAEKTKSVELEGAVSSAKAGAMQAQEVAATTQEALTKLEEAYIKLEARFEQFSKNMRTLDGSSPAPSKSDAATAMELLNQMSTE